MSPHEARPLLIFPCNGNGLEALDCLGEAWQCVGFVDDSPQKQSSGAYGLPVMQRSALAQMPEVHVLAVPGSPTSYMHRKRVVEELGISSERFAQVIHPAASVSPRATLGRNVLIMAGAVVTSNAVIGSHVCILPNTVVHHDSVVGDWTLIGSNVTVAGGVTIGRNCYIGSGSSIMNGLRIGEGVLIGLGSNVIRNVAPGACMVGNPARPLAARTHTLSN